MSTATYISLTEATKLCPHRPHVNTLRRWVRRGQKARNGERIRLTALRIGSELYTTEDWLNEYWEKLSKADQEYFDRHDSVTLDAEDATDALLKEFNL